MANTLSPRTRALVIQRIEKYDELTPEEQAAAAIKVIAGDFYIYMERNLSIKDKLTRQIIPLDPNWAQKKLIETVIDDLAHGRPVRYIVLKARQMGLSTIIEALCFWWTTTHRYVNSVIIAHEVDAASNLYKMFRRYYDNCHEHFQPDRKYNTKKDLVFDVDDEVKRQYQEQGLLAPGLGSEIKTMVAKEGKGRSDTINFFHGSEVAFWEDNADVVSSAMQAIPLGPETFAFLESTANGVGGYFYDEWQTAKRGESSFRPLFFAWHEHPEYELASPDVMVYDDEELELIDIFKEKGYPIACHSRKIMWRREKKKEFRTEPKKFYQEYPKDDMEAFLASGRPVFDIKVLQKMEEKANEHADLVKFGEVVPNPNPDDKQKYVFVEKKRTSHDQEPTPLKVWWLPEEKHRYVIGVDVSEGIEIDSNSGKVSDWSVIDVTDVENGRTVARWRGHIDPDLLGAVVYNIGTFYNTALVGPEINNHGLTTAQSLRNKFYRNLYTRESSEDDQFQVRTAKFGWKTDKKTKPMMINELVRAIREGDIIDLDIVFIRECMTYVKDDQGHTNAQDGQFDDCVMAKAIALQMADWSTYNTDYAKEKIHKPLKRKTNNNATTASSTGRTRASSTRDAVQRRRAQRRAHRITRTDG